MSIGMVLKFWKKKTDWRKGWQCYWSEKKRNEKPGTNWKLSNDSSILNGSHIIFVRSFFFFYSKTNLLKFMTIRIAAPLLLVKVKKRFGRDWTRSQGSSQTHRQAILPSRVSCPQGQPSSFKTLPDTLQRGRRWWAEEVSSYKRVMGDVRRAQSSTCSPRLCRDIQFPVCQWQDVSCISSEEITTHSLWRKKNSNTTNT